MDNKNMISSVGNYFSAGAGPLLQLKYIHISIYCLLPWTRFWNTATNSSPGTRQNSFLTGDILTLEDCKVTLNMAEPFPIGLILQTCSNSCSTEFFLLLFESTYRDHEPNIINNWFMIGTLRNYFDRIYPRDQPRLNRLDLTHQHIFL